MPGHLQHHIHGYYTVDIIACSRLSVVGDEHKKEKKRGPSVPLFVKYGTNTLKD